MKKNCKICNKEFVVVGNLQTQKKTCSYECWKTNNRAITLARNTAKATKTCKECGQEFEGLKHRMGTGRCNGCSYKKYSQERKGKNNPNFKSGKYTHANFQGRKSKVAYKHLNECRRYKKEFIAKHGYQFCEVCAVNSNGTPKFEVHHIYFASLWPRHPNLHDNRNLIHICLQCHHKFHSSVYKDVFKKLEKERGLQKLFLPTPQPVV